MSIDEWIDQTIAAKGYSGSGGPGGIHHRYRCRSYKIQQMDEAGLVFNKQTEDGHAGRTGEIRMSGTKSKVRFFRGPELLASVKISSKTPFAQIAENAGVDIPTNRTSGNCGTCLVKLINGSAELPEPLPPGRMSILSIKEDTFLLPGP